MSNVHPHFTTGQPCTCGFTAHLQKTTKTAGKLHDFLMNPQSRPDLQSPEGQAWLKLLQRHYDHIGDKFDPLTPWLTREWKKGRLIHNWDAEHDSRNPQFVGHMYWKKPFMWRNPDDIGAEPEPSWERQVLDYRNLGHWADFLQANHPSRRELGDIMGHEVQPFSERVDAWSKAMEEQAKDQALKGGEVYHTTPDNWTIRRLHTPEELTGEGDAMGHCVGGYASAVQRGHSQIYSLRDPEGHPHSTIEIHPRYVDWNGQLVDMNNLDMSQVEQDGEGEPVPHLGHVVQIQGKANQEPLDEYKSRIADWFRSFGDKRPTWEYDPEDDDGLRDYDGYWHHQIDHPDLIPKVERDKGSLEKRTEPYEDEYGLNRQPSNMEADYDDLLDKIKFHDYGSQGSEPNSDHIKDIYRLALARGEIPQLAKSLEGYQEGQQSNFDDWMDQNYEYAPRYPDEPHGYEDEEGEEADEDTPGARPYWEPNGSAYGDRYYDQAEAEKTYDEAYSDWERQHAGMNAVNQMYQQINPHWGANPQTGEVGYQNEIPPQQPQQATARTAKRLHKNPWGDPCTCPWDRGSHQERVGQVKESAKLDWLKERPDVQADRRKQFLVDHIFPGYGAKADPLLPWLMREYSKGELELHPNLNWFFDELNEAEQQYHDFLNAGFDPYSTTGRELQEKAEAHEQGARNVYDRGHGLWHRLSGIDPASYTDDIIDMMRSQKKRGQGIDLMQHNYLSVIDKLSDWREEEDRRQEEERRLNNGKIVHKFEGPRKGWTVRRLTTPDECELEGELMGHCVGSYGESAQRGRTNIYSLRDAKNQPHATTEIRPEMGNPEDATEWKIPEYLWDELPMQKFKGVPIEDIRGYHDEYAQHGVPATAEPRAHGAGQVYPEFMQKAVEAGTAIPPMDGAKPVQTQGKSNTGPTSEYTEMLDDFLRPHGVSTYKPWWNDHYFMEGPETIHDLVGAKGDDGAFDLHDSYWYENEPDEYQMAQADADEHGVMPPDLRVGSPNYHSILHSIIDPNTGTQWRGLRPNPWSGYNPEVGEYVLNQALLTDKREQEHPEWGPWGQYGDVQTPAEHTQKLREALQEHATDRIQVPPFEPDPLADPKTFDQARKEHFAPYESDPWFQMYHHLGPALGLEPIENYRPPAQIHPEQTEMFRPRTEYNEYGENVPANGWQYPQYEPHWDFDHAKLQQLIQDAGGVQNFNPTQENMRAIRQPLDLTFSKTASLYQRWVFSPATGKVELADNNGHPLDVKYHNDLARDLNEPNLVHGYAYRIGDGWRLTDWESRPIEDPYVIAQVMRRLQIQNSTPDSGQTPSFGDWEPIYDQDWDRSHHGIPGS